jgi:hypothetical protein
LESARQVAGKRARGMGKLRPSVVLYNEAHKDGEGVGEVTRKDLIGASKGKGRAGADLLLVVGTSLKVPGTKRIVREFAKAVHSRRIASSKEGSPVPSPSKPPGDDDPPIKTIYLNLDFPVPTREWEGVFDAWVQGDAQQFAQRVQSEMEKKAKAKEKAGQRKRQKEDEFNLDKELLSLVENCDILAQPQTPKKRKSKVHSFDSTKRQKLPTPPSSPRSKPATSDIDIFSDIEDEISFRRAYGLHSHLPEVVIDYHHLNQPPPITPKRKQPPNAHAVQWQPPTPDATPPRPSHTTSSTHHRRCSSQLSVLSPSALLSSPTLSLLNPSPELDDPGGGSRFAISYTRTGCLLA